MFKVIIIVTTNFCILRYYARMWFNPQSLMFLFQFFVFLYLKEICSNLEVIDDPASAEVGLLLPGSDR